jgi:hypothetical protein
MPFIQVEHNISEQKQQASSSSQHCVESPVPNHMVLTGWYLDMLGEFYERSYKDFINVFVNSPPKEQQLVFKNTVHNFILYQESFYYPMKHY